MNLCKFRFSDAISRSLNSFSSADSKERGTTAGKDGKVLLTLSAAAVSQEGHTYRYNRSQEFIVLAASVVKSLAPSVPWILYKMGPHAERSSRCFRRKFSRPKVSKVDRWECRSDTDPAVSHIQHRSTWRHVKSHLLSAPTIKWEQ